MEKIKQLLYRFDVTNFKEEIDQLLMEHNDCWEELQLITFEFSEEEDEDLNFLLKNLSVTQKKDAFDFYYFNTYSGECDRNFILYTNKNVYVHGSYDGKGTWNVFQKSFDMKVEDFIEDYFPKDIFIRRLYRPSKYMTEKFLAQLVELVNK